MTTPTDSKSLIRQTWSLFGETAKAENRSELIERLEPEFKRFELGLFRIVVMGEIKKGKTSFINALLGAPDLLPVESDIATSVVFKVLYGQERTFKIFFQPDVDTGKRAEPIVVTQEQLRDYGTETGNPGNEKRVDFIGVEEPNPLLKEGFVIVDTPGVGGTFKAHRDVSYRYAPNADAIFFVLDSVQSAMTKEEVEFLVELKDNLKKTVFFVQTKIDAVDSGNVQQFQEDNRKILQEKAGYREKQIRYFPISSKLKNAADEDKDSELLKDSGFLLLLDFLHNALKAGKDEILAAQLAAQIAMPVNQIFTDLQQQQQLAAASNLEEVRKVQGELVQTKKDIADWQKNTFQPEMQTFRTAFEDTTTQYRNRIQIEFNPNGTIVSNAIDKLKENPNWTPQKMVEKAELIQRDWLAAVSTKLGDMLDSYNREFSALVEQLFSRVGNSSDSTAVSTTVESKHSGVNFNTKKLGGTYNLMDFENLKTILYGTGTGSTLTVLGTVAASWVFPPLGALTTIAAIAGLFWGGYAARKELYKRQHTQVLNELEKIFTKMASQVQIEATQTFNNANRIYEKKVSEIFQQTLDDAKKRLETQEEQANAVLSQSKEQNAARIEDIKQRLSKVTALLHLLNALVKK